MGAIKISKTGAYFPEIKMENEIIEKNLNLEKGYIQKRTGIETRYYTKQKQEEMVKNFLKEIFKDDIEYAKDIELIIVSTTTPMQIMPGISNIIQRVLKIQTCICLDILAGCSGFINAIDIAQKYITTSTIKKALIVGIEQLSNFLDPDDISTAIILADGIAGMVLEKTTEDKVYHCKIEATIDDKDMLSTYFCLRDKQQLHMKGREVYKYAVTKPVENIQNLLNETGENLDNIKYIVPHQSNIKIIKSIASRLGEEINKKMYINIQNFGNTFCASIPIALNEMFKEKLISNGDKIILTGYGGGLNTGSILIEI